MRRLTTIPVGTRIGVVEVLERRGRSGSALTYIVRCDCGRYDQMKACRLRDGGDGLTCRGCVWERRGEQVRAMMRAKQEAKL